MSHPLAPEPEHGSQHEQPDTEAEFEQVSQFDAGARDQSEQRLTRTEQDQETAHKIDDEDTGDEAEEAAEGRCTRCEVESRRNR
jgi:hypothetical protein